MFKELITQNKGLNWQEILMNISKKYENIVFSTSFSLEDQIITDFIVRNKLNIKIFTIDTGRLFRVC